MRTGPVVCRFCALGQHRACTGIMCRCPKRGTPAHSDLFDQMREAASGPEANSDRYIQTAAEAHDLPRKQAGESHPCPDCGKLFASYGAALYHRGLGTDCQVAEGVPK